MTKTLMWISPMKAALISALLAFVVTVIFSLLSVLFVGFASYSPGGGDSPMQFGLAIISMLGSWVLFPFFVFLLTYGYVILVNLTLKLIGGLEVRLEEPA